VLVPYATCELEGVSVVQVMAAPEDVIEVALTFESTGGDGVLLTVTDMLLLVELRLFMSVATAVSE
jgi:hypothetical protein